MLLLFSANFSFKSSKFRRKMIDHPQFWSKLDKFCYIWALVYFKQLQRAFLANLLFSPFYRGSKLQKGVFLHFLPKLKKLLKKPFLPQKRSNWPKNWSYSVFGWFLLILKFSAENVKISRFFIDFFQKKRNFCWRQQKKNRETISAENDSPSSILIKIAQILL